MTNHLSGFMDWHTKHGLPHDSGGITQYHYCWCNPVEIWLNPAGTKRTPALVLHNTAEPYEDWELHNIFSAVLGSDLNTPYGPDIEIDWDDDKDDDDG